MHCIRAWKFNLLCGDERDSSKKILLCPDGLFEMTTRLMTQGGRVLVFGKYMNTLYGI